MSTLLMEMEGIEKSFPGVRAIRQGRFELRAGEIHALMGENGAGKSTLIKILGGALQPDAGAIRIDGAPVRIPSPHEARRLGVAVIYQEFNLVPTLTVRENIFLGRERARSGFIAAAEERKLSHGLFERLGFPLDLDALCRDLPIAQQQAVEIAKALLEKARILVMDEPTAALSSHEVEKLFQVVRDLRTQGIGMIYVSHRLDEIFALCDRVTVMRDGEHIATSPVSELSRQQLIELMVGRKLEAEFPKRVAKIGPPILEARGLCRSRAVRDVSLSIRSGEVLGLTGLVGAGRTELARLLFGADRAEAGTIFLRGQQPSPLRRERTGLRNLFSVAQTFLSAVSQAFQPADRPNLPRQIAQSARTAEKNVGETADSKVCAASRSLEFIPLQPVALRSPRDAIRSGVCLLTEDRKQQGLVLGLPVRENFALPNLPFFSRLGFMRHRSEREACSGFIQRLRIKVSHSEQLARNLSGGNQQKVVLAKWLQANSEVVIFDEPTRGIDVGAKFEIYQIINDLAAAGKAILMISSELPEILGMSDRILVMRAGSISGEINDVPGATQEQIMALAAFKNALIMNHRLGIAHLFNHYGMAIVLAFLCLYYSWATFTEQQPRGAAAAKVLAKQIVKTGSKSLPVLIVARTTEEDTAFVSACAANLEAASFTVAGNIQGDPRAVREMLQKLSAQNTSLGFVATTADCAAWTLFENVSEKFPALGHPAVVFAASYRWPSFLKGENLLNIANQITVVSILAVGMTVVIITGGIDLSVGSLIALAAVVTTLLIRDHARGTQATPSGLVLCSLASVLLCALVGLFSGAMVAGFRIPPFIATLAVMQVANGLAYILAKGQSIYEVPDSFAWLGRGQGWFSIPHAVLLMAVIYLVAHILMSRTTLGRRLYAVGGNAEAARLSGVSVGAVLLFAYTFCGALAGLGGVLLASQLKSGSPTYGASYELYVIAAVVVGGASLSGGEGKIFGTLIGALIIAVIQNGMNLTGVESYTQKVVLGAVILGAVLLDMWKRRGWPRWLTHNQ